MLSQIRLSYLVTYYDNTQSDINGSNNIIIYYHYYDISTIIIVESDHEMAPAGVMICDDGCNSRKIRYEGSMVE